MSMFPTPARLCASHWRTAAVLSMVAALAACSALPSPPTAPLRYDFGLAPAVAAAAAPAAPRPALLLADVTAPTLTEGATAMLYRLAYANAQELRPYQSARWSMPPAQLLQQRLRQQLGTQRAVLAAGEGRASLPAATAAPALLQVSIDEFSQVFESPQRSNAVLRLQATLVEQGPAGDRLLGQKVFAIQQASTASDAAGGAAAMARAVDASIAEIELWLGQWGR